MRRKIIYYNVPPIVIFSVIEKLDDAGYIFKLSMHKAEEITQTILGHQRIANMFILLPTSNARQNFTM